MEKSKPGPRPSMEKMSNVLQVCFYDDENELIRNKAIEEGCSISDFLRRMIMKGMGYVNTNEYNGGK